MELLWLGYDGLSVQYADVAVVLFYHPALDRRLLQSYGRVPSNVQSIVITSDGTYFPSSWSVSQLRRRLAHWRGGDRR